MVADSTILHERWRRDKGQRSPFISALLKLPRRAQHPVPELLLDHFNLKSGQGLVATEWGPIGDGTTLGKTYLVA